MSGIYKKRQANKKSLQATLRKCPNSSGHFGILLYTTNHWLPQWSHQGTNNVEVFNGCLFRLNNYSLKSGCLCIASVKIKTCIFFPQGVWLWVFFYWGMYNTEFWWTIGTWDQDTSFRIANVAKDKRVSLDVTKVMKQQKTTCTHNEWPKYVSLLKITINFYQSNLFLFLRGIRKS